MKAEVLFKNQLKMLESGIQNLRDSTLQSQPEFRKMLAAVKKHHQNVRLSHLTGTPKDSLDQTQQDTKFYYILVRMLNEVDLNPSADHLGNLQHVRHWYISNKHVLHTTPRFGKNRKKNSDEPVETVKNSIGRLQQEALQVHLKMNNTGHKNGAEKLTKSTEVHVQPSHVEQIVPEGKREQRPKTSPMVKNPNAPHSAKSVRSVASLPVDALLSKRKPQPLSHLYNPHGGNAAQLASENAEKDKAEKAPLRLKMKHSVDLVDTAFKSRAPQSNYLQKWESFQRASNFGQDYFSRMQHMGRSGLPGGVRYVAHENGLSAEDFTQEIVEHYSTWEKIRKESGADSGPKSKMNKLLKQSLEDFYETAKNYYPLNPPKNKATNNGVSETPSVRMQSAPAGGCRIEDTPTPSSRITPTPPKSAQIVKLDSVVGMIDSVTEEMSFHKEKLVPHPQPGFRQPILHVEERERPQTAPESSYTRPVNTPYDSVLCHRVEASSNSDPVQLDLEKIAALEAADWRGRISWHRLGRHKEAPSQEYPTPPMSHRSMRPRTAPSSGRRFNDKSVSEAPTGVQGLENDAKSEISFLSVHQLGGQCKSRISKTVHRKSFDSRKDCSHGETASSHMEFVSIVAPRESRGVSENKSNYEDSMATHLLLDSHGDCDETDDSVVWGGFSDFQDDFDMNDSSEAGGTSHGPYTSHGDDEASDKLIQQVSELVHIDSMEQQVIDSAPVRSLPLSRRSPNKSQPKDIEIYISGIHSDNVPEDMTEEQIEQYVQNKQQQIASTRSSAKSPRILGRSFPKEGTRSSTCSLTLKIEGHGNRRQRSAGSVPPRAKAADRFQMLVRQQEMLRKLPANRLQTPPSIPTAFNPHGSRKGQGSNVYSMEHEAHARKDTSPRNYMERVSELSRRNLIQVGADPPRQSLLNEETDPFSDSIRVIKLHQQQQLTERSSSHETPRSAPALTNAPKPLEIIRHRAAAEFNRGVVPRDIRIVIMPNVAPVEIQAKNLNEVGRPIPNYVEAQDPIQAQQQANVLREAKAAVDIQRIFRGFVARNRYQYLQRDEREKREDRQKAAVEIQRAYRHHLSRKRAIGKRAANPESIERAKQYKQTSIRNELQRQDKADEIAKQNCKQFNQASSKLSVIGPHVEVYEPFHPKNIAPEKKLLHLAATIIQRHTRGFLLRVKLERLKRKSKQHASSWENFLHQLKGILSRVQERIGIEKPVFDLNFDNINVYMDIKKRYESVFDRKAFGGELELSELPEYFKECDLYPAQSEIDEALGLILRGQPLKQGKGLLRQDTLELTFQLYPPSGTGIEIQRKSTWMNPIVDGVEASKLIGDGSESVESTDFKTCWNLVSSTRKVQNLKQQQQENEKREEEWTKKHGQPNAAPSPPLPATSNPSLNAIDEGEEEDG